MEGRIVFSQEEKKRERQKGSGKVMKTDIPPSGLLAMTSMTLSFRVDVHFQS